MLFIYMINQLDEKGVETVRRDNCKLVVEMMKLATKAVIIDEDPYQALQICKKYTCDLLTYKVPIHKLIISKNLSKLTYASEQPHTWVRKLIISRGENGPQVK